MFRRIIPLFCCAKIYLKKYVVTAGVLWALQQEVAEKAACEVA
jgi:hypothetical protein